MHFEPTDGAVGAITMDFPDDLCGLQSEEASQIRAAFDDHKLLVFRGREITPDEQVAVVETVGKIIDERGDGTRVTLLSNEQTSLKASVSKLGFHSDYTTCPYPLSGISLYAEALPDEHSSTVFADTEAAYEALDDTTKHRLDGMSATHCHPLNNQNYEVPIREANLSTENLRTTHPIEFSHPRTGQTLLFVNNQYLEGVNGLSASESNELIDQLNDWIRESRFQYRHRWQLHDLVVFDNLALQHARDENMSRGTRILRRMIFTQPEWHQASQEWFVQLVLARGY